MIEWLLEVFKINTRVRVRVLAHCVLLILLIHTQVAKETGMDLGDLSGLASITGDAGQFNTISQAKSSTSSDNNYSGVSSSTANSENGGKSISLSDSGKSVALAEGSNSSANAQSDEGKVSQANASTDSKGGSAAASALNNSNSVAQSYNGGKALASSEQNAKAKSTADGNSDSTALATDEGQATALAKSKTFEIAFKDDSSSLDLNTTSQAESKATASGSGVALANSNSLAGSIGTSMDKSKSTTNSDSKALAEANASEGFANSNADSLSLANASSSGASETTSNSQSDINAKSNSGSNQGDGSVNNANNSNANDNINLYLGNPLLTNIEKEQEQVKADPSVFSKNIRNQQQNEYNNVVFTDWESVYHDRTPDRYIRNSVKQNQIPLGDSDTNANLPDVNFPKQSQDQVKSYTAINNNFAVKWTYLGAVALDVAMGSEGDLVIVGKDNNLYSYDSIKSAWDKITANFEVDNIVRVDLGKDATPYVVTSAGDTYFLTCDNKWERLPGCARDIAVGRGGEVFKIGCEKRNGGFRIHKLLCDCKKNCNNRCTRFKKTFSYKKSKQINSYKESEHLFENKCNWISMDGAGVRVAVHPNGNPFVINETGSIHFYNGIDWKNIPDTNALDLAISNEGIMFYITNQFSLVKVEPKSHNVAIEFNYDFNHVKHTLLLPLSGIGVAAGPFSQPVLIGDKYRVYSSSKLGYN